MPPSVTFKWPDFYTRIKDVDPDLRTMALYDLQVELETDTFKLENEGNACTSKIVECFSVNETNSDVQSHAIRVVPWFVKKAHVDHCNVLLKRLANMTHETLLSNREQSLRENACAALKAAIPALACCDPSCALTVAKELAPGLKSADNSIRASIYSVLAELFANPSLSTTPIHSDVITAGLKDIGSSNKMVIRVAIACVAAVSAVCSEAEFARIMEFAMKGLAQPYSTGQRGYVQFASSVSRAAGSRFAPWITKVFPLLLEQLNSISKSADPESTDADESRENTLHALDHIIASCPTSVADSLPDVVRNATQLMEWDPNYCADDVDENGSNSEEADDWEDLLDAEDNSWKVRKASARCLMQIVKSCPDALPLVLGHLFARSGEKAPLVIRRLSERIENVLVEIIDLLRCALAAARQSSSPAGPMGQEPLRRDAGILHEFGNEIVRSLLRAARHKSLKIKTGVHTLLKDMFVVMGAQIDTTVSSCVQLLVVHLSDPSLAVPQLLPEVLEFARVITVTTLSTTSNTEALGSLKLLLPPVAQCSKQTYYRTAIAALKVLHELVGLLPTLTTPSERDTFAVGIFEPTYTRMSSTDTDSEVRRSAMEALANVLSAAEAALTKAKPSEVAKALEIIVANLKIDSIRVSSARSLSVVERCALPKTLKNAAVVELSNFLRKPDRQLREQGIRTLTSFIGLHSGDIDPESLRVIIDETVNGKLISESELFITALALQLVKKIIAIPKVSEAVATKVTPAVVKLLRTPVTQGQILTEAAELIADSSKVPNAGDGLFEQLLSEATKTDGEVPAQNIARAVGAICGAEQVPQNLTKKLDELVKMGASQDSRTAVAGLFALGEAGRWVTLHDAAVKVIDGALTAKVDDVKAAAVTALGRAASRQPGAQLLRKLVKSLESGEDLLRIRALRDCFAAMATDRSSSNTSSSSPVLRELSSPLFESLLRLSDWTNESVAEATTECLGRLAQIVPDVIDLVVARLPNVGSKPRSLLIAAMRFTLPQHASPELNQVVLRSLPSFLEYLAKKWEPDTRRAALQLLTGVAYNRPEFLPEVALRDEYFSHLLDAMEVDPTLIKTVDLGPFKHTTDAGAPVRKQSFECMGVLVDLLDRPAGVALEAPQRLAQIATALIRSLGSPESDFDIWSSARSTLVKLARHRAGRRAILGADLALLAKNLKAMYALTDKAGLDTQRCNDANFAAGVCALRLAVAIPDVAQHADFSALLKDIRASASAESLSKAAADG